jgi:hypothetical protein
VYVCLQHELLEPKTLPTVGVELTALPLLEVLTTTRAVEFRPKQSVTIRVYFQRGSFRPAAWAFFAEDAVAHGAGTGHCCLRIERVN